jgi:hypothetical protein
VRRSSRAHAGWGPGPAPWPLRGDYPPELAVAIKLLPVPAARFRRVRLVVLWIHEAPFRWWMRLRARGARSSASRTRAALRRILRPSRWLHRAGPGRGLGGGRSAGASTSDDQVSLVQDVFFWGLPRLFTTLQLKQQSMTGGGRQSRNSKVTHEKTNKCILYFHLGVGRFGDGD